jgi:hypothetical protein
MRASQTQLEKIQKNQAPSKSKKKASKLFRSETLMAEAVGFEPTVPEGTTDFESVPL